MDTEKETKYGLPILSAEEYVKAPNRYQLIVGTFEGAPLCPYGNHFKWLVLDKEKDLYVRATSSVFKKLLHRNTNSQ